MIQRSRSLINGLENLGIEEPRYFHKSTDTAGQVEDRLRTTRLRLVRARRVTDRSVTRQLTSRRREAIAYLKFRCESLEARLAELKRMQQQQ